MSDRGKTDASGDRLYGLLAEFETPAAIYEAAERVRDAGYRHWDCHTPFPVHGLDKAMGIRPTILPWIVMACGTAGATFGFLLQWFTNATSFDLWALVWVRGYDFLISGKDGPVFGGRMRRRADAAEQDAVAVSPVLQEQALPARNG
jgi:hypothetical protein